MTTTSPLSRLSSVLTGLLVVSGLFLIAGHIGSPELSPITNFISDYAARGVRWRWICAAMLGLGIVMFVFAYFFLTLQGQNTRMTLGGMCFVTSAVCMIFVAYYPTARLANHEMKWEWTDYLNPKAKVDQADRAGWDKAYSNAHFDMIRVSILGLIGGIVLCSSALISRPAWKRHAVISFVLAPIMAALFWAGHSSAYHGLFQRLGFLVVWSWMYFTALELRRAKSSVIASD